MIKNYIKIAFRNFWRHKLFTLINIIGLTIGISAALVIYLIVHFDFTFDKFHNEGDRIYRVVTNFSFSGSPAYNSGVCGPLPEAAKTQVTGLANAAKIFRLFQLNVHITGDNAAMTTFKNQDGIILTDNEYFSLFQYKWLAGSTKTSLSGPFQVVLTSEQAKKYFPSLSYEQMIGRSVVYDTIRTTVTGIVETLTERTDFTFHDFISFSTATANHDLNGQMSLHNWGGTTPERQLFVKLSPNTAVAHIEQQLNDILKRNNPPRPESGGKTQVFRLQPLADIHFNENYGTFNGRIANKTTLYELLAVALLLLSLGCINFINLTTAQSIQRAKEIGIRKTMGSSRGQLIFQFLSETFVITLFAVIVSGIMVPVILKLFQNFVPEGINTDLFSQPDLIVFLFVLTVTVSLVSGFYPALILSGYKPVSVIKNHSQTNASKTRNAMLRKSLTVAQFVIAQFFIMTTVLVSKQIYYAIHKDLGFKKDAIIIVNSPWKNRQQIRNRAFINKLRAIPQIELVSAGRDAPISDDPHSTEGSYNDGKRQVKVEDLSLKFGDGNYIKIYHIKLLAGRNLREGDTDRVLLINNTLAKRFGFTNPHDAVGKQIDHFNGDTKMQIIGVVSDFNQESIHAGISPLAIITSTNQYFNGTFHISLKPVPIAIGTGSNDWQTAIAGIQKAWKETYPDDVFEYHFFDETIANLYKNEQNTSTLLNWATGLSIFISCLGLLGLAIYTTNQRTKEIGVRKVLGATVAQIVALLSTELILLILLAFVIVSPIAWYAMNKWMETFADRTSISWWIFAASGAGMLLAAVFTSSFQTVRAAVANPVNSLRSE